MKTHTHQTQKGFIALFFTLGISSILLAYVATSSTSIFDFVRAREGFYTHREIRVDVLNRADEMIDVLVRTPVIHPDTYSFSFASDGIYVTGTIHHGLISNLSHSNFSL